jgi:hypothetical protein
MAERWFRSYHGAPTDAKWIVVARKAGKGITPGHVAAVWWYLMDVASQSNPRGSLASFDAEVCAASYGWDESIIARIFAAMEAKQLIVDANLASWEERQPKREDVSTQRVRRYRETHETQSNAMKRDVTPEEIREEEIREEVIDAKPKVNRGSQLPDDWEPSETHHKLAAKMEGIRVSVEVDKFRDYHKSKGSVRKDWDAGFRTWLRNAKEFQRGRISPDSQAGTRTNETPQSTGKRTNAMTQAGAAETEADDDARIGAWQDKNAEEAASMLRDCYAEVAGLPGAAMFGEFTSRKMAESKFRSRVIAEFLTPKLAAS